MDTKKFVVAGAAIPVLGAAVFGGWKLKEWVAVQDLATAPNTFNDEVARRVDAKWLTWKQAEEINTGLKTIESFVRIGDTHIVCVGGKEMKILSRTGAAPISVSLTATAKAVTAVGDKIYAGVRDHVELFDLSGKTTGTWPTFGQGAVITAITVAGDNVYVADAGQRVVYRTDLSGEILQRFGQRDESKHYPGLILPSPHLDVALHDGLLWINNPGQHELEGFDSSGNMVRHWGAAGMTIEKFAGCCNPTDFAIFADGRFVTSEKGVPRVKIYSSEGQLQSVVGGPDIFGADVGGMDLSIDAAGRVWVAENARGIIRVFEPK